MTACIYWACSNTAYHSHAPVDELFHTTRTAGKRTTSTRVNNSSKQVKRRKIKHYEKQLLWIQGIDKDWFWIRYLNVLYLVLYLLYIIVPILCHFAIFGQENGQSMAPCYTLEPSEYGRKAQENKTIWENENQTFFDVLSHDHSYRTTIMELK